MIRNYIILLFLLVVNLVWGQDQYIVTKDIYLKSNPDKFADDLISIPKGTQITLGSRTDSPFIYAKFKDEEGYISLFDLELLKETESAKGENHSGGEQKGDTSKIKVHKKDSIVHIPTPVTVVSDSSYKFSIIYFILFILLTILTQLIIYFLRRNLLREYKSLSELKRDIELEHSGILNERKKVESSKNELIHEKQLQIIQKQRIQDLKKENEDNNSRLNSERIRLDSIREELENQEQKNKERGKELEKLKKELDEKEVALNKKKSSLQILEKEIEQKSDALEEIKKEGNNDIIKPPADDGIDSDRFDKLEFPDEKEQLIKDIYEIIKDYREDEGLMSKERIENWINQFSINDHIFLLKELKLIFQKRYISKNNAINLIKVKFEGLAKKLQYKDVKNFLLQSRFIDHQPEGKSQKVLLKFVDDFIIKEYSISIENCNSPNPKYYIYLDDILCTGDTLVKGLTKNSGSKGWFFKLNESGKSNLEIFKANKAKFIFAFFCIHKFNADDVIRKIYNITNLESDNFIYEADNEYLIENDTSNKDSKLNFIFPKENIRDKVIDDCKIQIEEKIRSSFPIENKAILYRENAKPTTETFFSSEANRQRFEKIILSKSIEIYNRSEPLKNNLRSRPLGYGLNNDANFGFGALIFTWRNVPFNVPIVFWYSSNNWKSLFERKFITYD